MIYFISGHGDLTQEEFDIYYKPAIDAGVQKEATFLLGDFRGCDRMCHDYLQEQGYPHVNVYHMFEKPRYETIYQTHGGYDSDKTRDEAMTALSFEDIAWVRPGKEKSGTAKNLKRRKK